MNHCRVSTTIQQENGNIEGIENNWNMNRSQQNIFIEEMKIIPKLKHVMKLFPQHKHCNRYNRSGKDKT